MRSYTYSLIISFNETFKNNKKTKYEYLANYKYLKTFEK